MRRALACIVGWSMILAVNGPVWAQQYPSKPVRIVVPYAVGGTTDILARILADELTRTLGQSVVPDFRPGAGGTIGSDHVAKSEPDGHTIVMGTPGSHATSPSLYSTLPYDPQKDFAPIALMAMVPNVVVVHPSIQAKSIADLIGLMKASPGKFHYGSAGVGATTHLTGELFKTMAGVDIVHVPYKGSGQAMIDLVGGHIQMMFENLPGAMSHVKSGNIRALAVTGARRSPADANLPTVAEAGVPGFDVVSWFGILAPARTPRPIVDKLNGAIVAAIGKPEVKARMLELGAEPAPGTPEDFAKLIGDERERWAKVIKAAGIQPN